MRRVLPLLAFVSLAFAPAPFPKPDPSKEDLRKLQGEWVRIHLVLHDPVVEDLPVSIAMKVRGDVMGFDHSGHSWSKTFLLDSRKRPKQIDVLDKEGSRSLGLYRLEGDIFTIAWRRVGMPGGLPTNFDSADPTVILEVYKRMNP